MQLLHSAHLTSVISCNLCQTYTQSPSKTLRLIFNFSQKPGRQWFHCSRTTGLDQFLFSNDLCFCYCWSPNFGYFAATWMKTILRIRGETSGLAKMHFELSANHGAEIFGDRVYLYKEKHNTSASLKEFGPACQ